MNPAVPEVSPAKYELSLKNWCSGGDISVLAKRLQLQEEGRPPGFWNMFSCFQMPVEFLAHAGAPIVSVAAYLYSRGASASTNYLDEGSTVSFCSWVPTVATVTGVTVDCVKRALHQLEQLQYINRIQRHKATGKFGANKVILTDPDTGRPLESPGGYGLLSSYANEYEDAISFITVPRAL